MKKLLTVAAIFLAISLLCGCGCGWGQKPATGKKLIKVGVLSSLTGKTMAYGQSAQEGLEIALAEVNKDYDFNIKLIYEDTQSQPKEAVSAANKLISIDNVSLIVGPILSDETLAVAPIAESKKRVLLTPVASAEDITKAGDFIFRLREGGSIHGKGAADFIYKKLNIKSSAILFANATNSITYKDGFENHFRSLGGEIIYSEGYLPGSADFKTSLSKIKVLNPDALYFSPNNSADFIQAIQQIRELNINTAIVTNPFAETPGVTETLGQQANDIVYTYPYFNPEEDTGLTFDKKLQAMYNKKSDIFAAYSYDALKILAIAIDKCGGDNSECVKTELYKIKDYQGAGGNTSFDENGDAVKSVMLKTVRNGQFVKYEE